MALQLEKDLENGFTGNYWKIIAINFDISRQFSDVQLALYKDRETMTARKDYISSENFSWIGGDFPFLSSAMDVSNPIKIAYNKIKTLPGWEGAVDC